MVTYTSSSTYWAPLKPRIRIYALSDSTYASPLYTYNPFTDVGESTKPIALNFDSQTENVGSFSIEIEDKDSVLDPDTYMRGNRVFIDCSKDGSVFQPAFKGLVRGTDQNIYATSGRNLVLNGYSYLVRLNERVLNVIKESSVIAEEYNRNDSTMFTDNLINDLLTTNSNYVYSDDDTALYSIFKKTNITSSPVVDWIPRLDAQMVTVNDAINSILEYSNGLVMLNPADDELMLYTSDLVTSANSIFLLTNQMNQNADDADYTMYPLEPYKYNISYDYPESGSRLIGSIGEGAGGAECPEEEEVFPASLMGDYGTACDLFTTSSRALATVFQATNPIFKSLAVPFKTIGNNSSGNTVTAKVWTNTAVNGLGAPGSQVGSNILLHKDGIVGTPFPSSDTYTFIVKMLKTDAGIPVTPGVWYFLSCQCTHSMSSTNKLEWIVDTTAGNAFDQTTGNIPPSGVELPGRFSTSPSGTAGSWTTPGTNNQMPGYNSGGGTSLSFKKWRFEFAAGGSEACGGGGGTQATKDADPVFTVAHDRNMSNRLGVVERVITDIPIYIKTKQTLQEYLFNKLSFAAKPRFTFDFPSVSMPNKMPKAGDIVTHVDSTANVGTANAPIQTGVIQSVEYDFSQGTDGALGLRRIGLSTTGIKRGSY